ncbi:MAG TPA: hypothetical protein VF720_14425 [Candidatus Eisenbacteria bacterium]
MLRILAILVGLVLASDAAGKVLNVEFKFTPFTGDPDAADMVQTVPGHAVVWMNNIPVAEQEIEEEEVPVLFDEREVAASIWVPTESLGGMVRQGRNTIRIEFQPSNGRKPYRAQLRWSTVLDETSQREQGGTHAATNEADAGLDDRPATGKVTFEREFTAEFAMDQPWHHAPAVTALTDDDRKALAELVVRRLKAFAPDFAGIYELIGANGGIDVEAVRKEKCLDKAWEAGIRIAAVPTDRIEFLTTGNAEVVIRAKEGPLYVPENMAVFETITDPEMQMCIGSALSGVYPPRLIVVRAKDGSWNVAY